MLVIPIKETENIERPLKRYKNKYTKVGIAREIRKRLRYKKSSTKRREEKLKAIYRENFKRKNS